jgi:hypothetical protein
VAKYPCPECRKDISATKNDRYRSHTGGDGESCVMASVEIPQHILDAGPLDAKSDPGVPVEGVDFAVCPQCTRKVKLTRLGYFEPHDQTLRGGDRCPVSGVRVKHARKVDDVPLPGDEPKPPTAAVPKVKDSATPVANRGLAITSTAPTSTSAGAGSSPTEPPPSSGTTAIDWDKVGDLKHLGVPADSPVSTGSSGTTPTADRPVHELNLERQPMGPPLPEPPSLESTSTSPDSPAPDPDTSSDAEEEPVGVVQFHLAPLLDEKILQPFSHILQPTPYEKVRAEPMGDLAKELATKVQETFYAYSNRKTSDNRSAQTTLGPSEIGTPCDRRLAMALLGVAPVNPGGDGWAAFVGTCTHVGMAEVYTFADAGTGRYAVELPVFLGTPTVPRGTTDLLDRRDGTVIDWKIMGSYSLKKFKEQGPSATYRTQAHVYGLGAERGGEKVRNVAVVGLPRAGRSLDEMHIWTEKYDRKFAEGALRRVELIANEISRYVDPPMEVAASFDTADDCRYCPFHLKNDKEMKRGCPGR